MDDKDKSNKYPDGKNLFTVQQIADKEHVTRHAIFQRMNNMNEFVRGDSNPNETKMYSFKGKVKGRQCTLITKKGAYLLTVEYHKSGPRRLKPYHTTHRPTNSELANVEKEAVVSKIKYSMSANIEIYKNSYSTSLSNSYSSYTNSLESTNSLYATKYKDVSSAFGSQQIDLKYWRKMALARANNTSAKSSTSSSKSVNENNKSQSSNSGKQPGLLSRAFHKMFK